MRLHALRNFVELEILTQKKELFLFPKKD